MSPRRLVIWIVVLVLAGGAYYWSLSSQQKKEAAQDQAARLLSLDDPLNVQVVELGGQQYAQPVRIERRDQEHSWRITTPVDYAADNLAVGRLLSALLEAKVKKRLAKADKPADFGLEPPRITVALTDRKGVRAALKVGDLSPTREYLYAAPDKGEGLWLLEPKLRGALARTLVDLRDKRVVDFVPSDITGLELAWAGREHHLVRKKGGAGARWEFAGGGQASTSQVESLLYKIHGLETLDFLDKGIDLKAQGLEPPAGKVVLSREKGGPLGLILGGPAATGGERYARRLSGGPVLVVKESQLKSLETTQKDLAERRVLPLDREKAVKLEITGTGVNLVYSKEQGAWQRQQPPGSGQEGQQASLFLWDLGDLKWERLLEPGEGPDLASPAWTITVTLDKGQGQVARPKLLLDNQPLKDGLLPAQVEGDSRRFGVSADFSRQIPGAGAKTPAREQGKGK